MVPILLQKGNASYLDLLLKSGLILSRVDMFSYVDYCIEHDLELTLLKPFLTHPEVRQLYLSLDVMFQKTLIENMVEKVATKETEKKKKQISNIVLT